MTGHDQPSGATGGRILPLRAFVAHSLAWIEVILASPVPALSDLLVEWRGRAQGVYAAEQAPIAQAFVRAVSSVVDDFPSWTKADAEAVLVATWPRRAPGADSLIGDEYTRMVVERLQTATAGTTGAQWPVLTQLRDILEQEELRLRGADGTALTDVPAPNPDGALPPEYLALVVATWSVPHYAPTGVPARGWAPALRVDEGLTEAECAAIENSCGFRFPPDLRSLLRYAVPVGDRFVNWRDGAALEKVQAGSAELLQSLWGDIVPTQTPYFDMSAAGEWELVTPEFAPRTWPPMWGPVPQDREAAYAVLCEQFERAPRLIPFAYGSIPDGPHAAGNPVYSCMGADIILLGNDLANYLYQTFGVPRPAWASNAAREVPFWSELIRLNNG